MIVDRESVVNETIELKAKQWIDYQIVVQKGDVLHYVARESAGNDFDLYLVPEENVAEHDFWTDYSLFEEEYESYSRGSYKFKTSGTFYVVISNYRAKSVLREIYVKLEIERSGDIPNSVEFSSEELNRVIPFTGIPHNEKVTRC